MNISSFDLGVTWSWWVLWLLEEEILMELWPFGIGRGAKSPKKGVWSFYVDHMHSSRILLLWSLFSSKSSILAILLHFSQKNLPKMQTWCRSNISRSYANHLWWYHYEFYTLKDEWYALIKEVKIFFLLASVSTVMVRASVAEVTFLARTRSIMSAAKTFLTRWSTQAFDRNRLLQILFKTYFSVFFPAVIP